jgi:hypothetical protein
VSDNRILSLIVAYFLQNFANFLLTLVNLA